MPKINSSKIIIDSLLYDFKQDKRFLIPFITGSKIGFCDKERNIVIQASFSVVLDDFFRDWSLVRVGTYKPVSYKSSNAPYLRLNFGVINSKGDFIIPMEYEGIAAPECSSLFSVFSIEKGYAVFNEAGKCIVPFGKFSYIDGFSFGYARIKNGSSGCLNNDGDKWGIIDEKGNITVPIEYNSISKFYNTSQYSTLDKNGSRSEFSPSEGKIFYYGYFDDMERQAQKEQDDYESLCRYRESQSDIESIYDPF